MAKISKRYDDGRTRTDTSVKERKKKTKTKVTLMNEAGKDKLLNPLLITLACWQEDCMSVEWIYNLPRIGRLCSK